MDCKYICLRSAGHLICCCCVVIVDTGQTETSGCVLDPIFSAQFLELGVVSVVGNKCHTDNRWHLVSQHKTGTLSHCMLTEVQRTRSQHLWICSMHNESDLTTNCFELST